MDAHVGDQLVVNSRQIGQSRLTGEIVEVIGRGSGEHYRVRWADGHESIVFPGTDAVVVPSARAASTDPEMRTVTIELRLEEDTEQCEATATMRTSMATFTGWGRARRNPDDPVVPMIGEELAIARALADLADKMEEAARTAIAARESRPLHLVP